MESVEVRFGRGDKRRTLGWLVVGADGWLKYHQHEIVERHGHVTVVKRSWPNRDMKWTGYYYD